jgi:hypothetical protein
MQPLEYETPSADPDPAIVRQCRRRTFGACVLAIAGVICLPVVMHTGRTKGGGVITALPVLMMMAFLLLAWVLAILGIIRSVQGMCRGGNNRALWIMFGICGVIAVGPWIMLALFVALA